MNSSIFSLLFTLLAVLVFCQATSVCPDGIALIVESIPSDLSITTNISTYTAWSELINKANVSIDIADFYFTLDDHESTVNPKDGGWMGIQLSKDLVTAHNRGVKIRVVLMPPETAFPQTQAIALQKAGVIELLFIDWQNIVPGNGIVHTKMWYNEHAAYVGSANADWRALSQVKELGMYVKNCPTLVGDAHKTFEQLWYAGTTGKLPTVWPAELDTPYNLKNPMVATLNKQETNIYVAESPPAFVFGGREWDANAIVTAIDSAQYTVDLEVMDYMPRSEFQPTGSPPYYWSTLDDAFRRAALRGVYVNLMFARWDATSPFQFAYISSLNEVNNIEVRQFIMPAIPSPPPIPYTRVNHAKFMVVDGGHPTQSKAWIGTSNWVPGYFLYTHGVSWNVLGGPLVSQCFDIFNRDWKSEYVFRL